MFFSKVSSFRVSNTFDFLFSILTSKEESVNAIESLTTEYGDSPGWIARLFLQKRKEKNRLKRGEGAEVRKGNACNQSQTFYQMPPNMKCSLGVPTVT